MTVVSFHTGGTYAALVARLQASCDRHGLPYLIYQTPDRGSWLGSNNAKPQLILKALIDHRQPVLYCDADCEILRKPVVPPGVDFGCYSWKHDPDPAWNVGGFDPSVMLSSGGVLYFNYTAPAMELLVRWIDAMRDFPTGIDDQILDYVINTKRPPVNFFAMEKAWNWMAGIFGEPNEKVIIRHDYKAGGHRQGTQAKIGEAAPTGQDDAAVGSGHEVETVSMEGLRENR